MDIVRKLFSGYWLGLNLIEWILKEPLLLFFRVIWGYQFAISGWGKLGRIDEVAAWFGGDLGLPAPTAMAYTVGTIEFVCGILLIIGLFGRFAAIPLTITMIGAFMTADWYAIEALFNGELGPFVSSTPFPFMLTSLMVLIFGSGWLSFDGLIGFLGWLVAGPKKASTS